MTNTTKTLQKTQLELPTEVALAFVDLGADTERRNGYIAALRGLEWTLQSISEASGLTRERVRQIVKAQTEAVPGITGLPYPEPPAVEVKEPRQYVEPDPDKLAELLSLQLAAQSVRSNSPKYRTEAERYTALVAEVHLTDGVPLYRLSKRLSEDPAAYGTASHGALRFRLARYGYKLPSSGGNSKVYTPIKTANRVRSAV